MPVLKGLTQVELNENDEVGDHGGQGWGQRRLIHREESQGGEGILRVNLLDEHQVPGPHALLHDIFIVCPKKLDFIRISNMETNLSS